MFLLIYIHCISRHTDMVTKSRMLVAIIQWKRKKNKKYNVCSFFAFVKYLQRNHFCHWCFFFCLISLPLIFLSSFMINRKQLGRNVWLLFYTIIFDPRHKKKKRISRTYKFFSSSYVYWWYYYHPRVYINNQNWLKNKSYQLSWIYFDIQKIISMSFSFLSVENEKIIHV